MLFGVGCMDDSYRVGGVGVSCVRRDNSELSARGDSGIEGVEVMEVFSAEDYGALTRNVARATRRIVEANNQWARDSRRGSRKIRYKVA